MEAYPWTREQVYAFSTLALIVVAVSIFIAEHEIAAQPVAGVRGRIQHWQAVVRTTHPLEAATWIALCLVIGASCWYAIPVALAIDSLSAKAASLLLLIGYGVLMVPLTAAVQEEVSQRAISLVPGMLLALFVCLTIWFVLTRAIVEASRAGIGLSQFWVVIYPFMLSASLPLLVGALIAHGRPERYDLRVLREEYQTTRQTMERELQEAQRTMQAEMAVTRALLEAETEAARQELAQASAAALALQQELRVSQAILRGESAAIPREYIPVDLRRFVMRRAGFQCQYCGDRGTPGHGPDGGPWHIDHVVAVDRGGPTRADNLTLACETCNLRKGAMPAYLFVQRLIQEARQL
jgi:signal transduction histidine kinase